MKKITLHLVMLLVIIGNSSCFLHFYKTAEKKPETNLGKATTIDSLLSLKKYFILNNAGYSYYMNELSISSDQQTLSCKLDSLPSNHKLFVKKGPTGNMRYKPDKESNVLTEVHLYIPFDKTITVGDMLLPLSKVEKIDIIEKDNARTTSNQVLSYLGVTLGAAVVAGAIILATSSCPYVSAYDGHQFSLQGEAYSGAVYPQMVKDDYMPLKMQPTADGYLQLKISNELKEKQNTDLAELITVTHNKNTEVLTDDQGNLYEIIDPKTPVSALFSNQKNVTEYVEKKNDNKILFFDDTLASANYVTLVFSKPKETAKAKLVLTLKNSLWMDYVYNEMLRGLGTYYYNFAKQQNKKSTAELNHWAKEQQMPMEVSLKVKNGWQVIKDIQVLGPAVNRKLVVPIDITDADNETLQIKLSSGFLFWEIDYAAIDYTQNSDLSVTIVSPQKAIDENSNDVLAKLINPDANYLEQPSIGNTVTINYPYTPVTDPEKTQSFILHTKGYYTHYGDFKNKPDIKFLKQFKNPGALPAFSLALFKKFRNSTLNSYVNN